MNELEEIQKRLKKRKGTDKPLNDHSFNVLYRGMIKFMILLVVGLGVLSYTKTNPGFVIHDTILSSKMYNQVSTWVTSNMLAFLPQVPKEVSTFVNYQPIGNDGYTNNSNEVVNLQSGKVIYRGQTESLGGYVTVLFDNEVQVTYASMDHVDVELYQTVKAGSILGTYQDKVVLLFEYLGRQISYEEYLGME